jgi:type II secretory pathway pseudopilin PulG
MRKKHKHYGFSLTEVLLAVGTLSIGMIFVAGVFPVAIYFSTIASEQTIAAVAADEAFAKIRLYGEVTPDFQNWLAGGPFDRCVNFNNIMILNPDEFAYPSTDTPTEKRYYWSALCRRVETDPASRLVQVTVFISRKISAGATYRVRRNTTDPLGAYDYPEPVLVSVSPSPSGDPNELVINDVDPVDPIHEETFINDDYTIVDNETGRLYRVLERDRAQLNKIILDRPWQGGSPAWVWVVPPPVNGGRYPCIAVYQKVIGFQPLYRYGERFRF